MSTNRKPKNDMRCHIRRREHVFDKAVQTLNRHPLPDRPGLAALDPNLRASIVFGTSLRASIYGVFEQT